MTILDVNKFNSGESLLNATVTDIQQFNVKQSPEPQSAGSPTTDQIKQLVQQEFDDTTAAWTQLGEEIGTLHAKNGERIAAFLEKVKANKATLMAEANVVVGYLHDASIMLDSLTKQADDMAMQISTKAKA